MPAEPYQSLYFYPRDKVVKMAHDTGQITVNPAGIIVGQQIGRVNLSLGNDHMVIQVAFIPGGFFRLFGIPMQEFCDISMDSAQVLGKEMARLNDRLANEQNYLRMIGHIEDFLKARLARTAKDLIPLDRVMQLMLNEPDKGMDQWASLACLSTRQFERKFLERVGVSPKMYTRIVRFNRTLDYKRRHPDVAWLEAAYAFGYFDYAHLIRDFKLFTGETPVILFESDQRSLKDMSENVVFLHPSELFG